jgi:hypothetical protein
MNAPYELDWTSANQQLLVAEFARLRTLLGKQDTADAQAAVARRAARLHAPAAIDILTERFALSPFERDIVLLAAGIEMDAAMAQACRDATGHAFATFGLAMAALPDAHWSAVAPLEPLRRWRLIEVDDSSSLTTGRLRLDERVLHHLAGLQFLDHRLLPLISHAPTTGLMAGEHHQLAQALSQRLKAQPGPLPVVQLTGDDGHAQRDVACSVATALGAQVFCLPAQHIPTGVHECASLATLWQREAALLGGALLVTAADGHAAAVAALVQQLRGMVFVAGREPVALDSASWIESVRKPDIPAQRALWQQALGTAGEPLGTTIDTLASRHRLGARRLGEVAAQARTLPPEQIAAHLHQLCRGDDTALRDLAQRIEPNAGWTDLVLPDAQRRMLEQVAMHTRQRIKVLHDWGFADQGERGLGLATLFAGESGTGKTLAAEALACELGLPLYRIDLSAVISKYIGETEKNLRKVFDNAEDIGAILLFDEADALFGKRSEVKDSHDRYANIEVSYLLQRMEAYRGLAILTTNHRAALDSAFSRRLRFVVQFPFPDTTQREAIWRGVFPARAPVGHLDFAKLARLNATGGSIRNIALTAAFLAAEAGTPVTMALLHQAARLEAAKRDTPFSDAEMRGWV